MCFGISLKKKEDIMQLLCDILIGYLQGAFIVLLFTFFILT